MLRIRAEQMQSLEAAAFAAFEARMVDHLRTFFPWHYCIWGMEGARKIVRYGVQRARANGFISERNICVYLTLMAVLGGNFDEDVQLSWVHQILADPTITEADTRIDRLAEEAMKFLDRVVGKDDGYLNRAVLRMRSRLPQLIADPSYPSLPAHAAMLLSTIFPQKYRAVGEERIQQLIAHGVQRAHSYGINTREGELLFIGFMFVFGSGFDHDPQLSACGVILNTAHLDAAGKTHQLRELVLDYIDKWVTWTAEPDHG